VAYGAAQGMPINPADLEKVQLRLFKENPNKTISRAAPFIAAVKNVHLNTSSLTVTETETRKLNTAATYQAEFTALPRSFVLPIWLNARPAVKTQFENWYKDFPNGGLMWVNKPEEARYELRLTGNTIEVWNLRTKSLVQGFGAMSLEAAEKMVGVLGNIEKSERTRRLNKRAAQLNEKDFDVVFSRIDQRLNVLDTWKRTDPSKSFDINLDYQQVNNAWLPVYYKVDVQNKSKQDVFVTLLFLSRMFDVQAYYPSQLLKAGGQLTELKKGGLIIKDEQLNSVSNQFKVIISTTELDISAMTQAELELGIMHAPSRSGASKGDAIDFEFTSVIDDWFVQNIEVTLNRCVTQVSPNNKATVSQAGISIAPHPSFKGNVSVASSATATRSIDADFSQLAAAYAGELVQLAPDSRSVSANSPTVITINDIQNADSLKTTPLEIDISHDISNGQNLMAVTIDAETGLLIPVGTCKRKNDALTTISISEIPASDTQTRSLGRALKFALMKFRGQSLDNIFMLRRVVYKTDGTIEQTEQGVADAVQKSKKVLLVIHGIIGNTSEQAAAMRFAVEQKGYDLVLSFDYENLNTRIEDIAAHLDKRLTAAGFHAKANKELHIVAHSMGGLVSRYAIENLQAHTYVDRLIMCGTPNGGSNFGKLPGAISGLNWLLGLGLNFAPKVVADIVGKLNIVSSKVLITLGQMDPNGVFIKQLAANKRPPNTLYVTLAGNIKEYKGTDAGLMARLFEKIELSAGKLAYWNEPNDIAVSVAAISQIPPATGDFSQQLPCHHLNYFNNGDSVSALSKIL
jgi:pimeloyl-ACP methyl ester carboxylesterase